MPSSSSPAAPTVVFREGKGSRRERDGTLAGEARGGPGPPGTEAGGRAWSGEHERLPCPYGHPRFSSEPATSGAPTEQRPLSDEPAGKY